MAFVTHDREKALLAADQMINMDGGRLLRGGTVRKYSKLLPPALLRYFARRLN